jgi:2-hydroxy-4-(methylsulfanyl)butanoate S-methyltransferase
MVSTSPPASMPTTILRHARSVAPAMAMLAGMQLNVFTELKDGPLTATEIAAAIGVQPAKLMPLLYALVVAELLTVRDGCFSNTQEAHTYLVHGNPAYMGSRQEFFADTWRALLKTAASIRAGLPQHKHDFYAMTEEEMSAFFRGLHMYTVADGEFLAKAYDFSRFRHLLDVGAGSGGVAIGVCRNCPGLVATVADLPKVIPVTRRFLDETSVADRVTAVIADVVAGPPPGTYDVAVMRAFIQVLSLENAQAAVRNVAQSLMPGGTLFIIGAVLDDSRLSPENLVSANLIMLNVYDDGLNYTEGEYRSLLVEAGLTEIEVRLGVLSNNASLVSARKPGETP